MAPAIYKETRRGQFPSAGDVQFISAHLVDEAEQREHIPDRNAPLIIGVDVARYGSDHSVIFSRVGEDARSFEARRFLHLDGIQLSGRVIEVIREFRLIGLTPSGLFVDGGGNGGAVVDYLRHLNYAVTEVQFGSRPTDNMTYRYKGDEMWGRMRHGLRRLCLPPFNTKIGQLLRADLTQREFAYTVTGHKIHLEPKKDMKARGVDSPDIADALALTYAEDVVALPFGHGLEPSSTARVISEYDPLEQKW